MTFTSIEQLVPGLGELRARERQNRALAFAGLTHTLCGVEVMPLTPRHRLALQLLRNAFTVPGVEPLAGDLFAFLWLLSPAYRSPGQGGRMAAAAAAWQQWRLRRHVRRLSLSTAVREVRLYLVDQLQDSPESSGDGSDFSPWVHWAAADAGFWLNIHGGFTLESYFATPYLVLQQLHRMWRINHPNITYDSRGYPQIEEPCFTNQSDQIVGAWHRQQSEAVADFIRNQRERRPA